MGEKKGKKRHTQNIEPAPKPRVMERKKAKCGANWFENRKIQTASNGWGTPVLMAHRIVPSFEKPRGASTCAYVMHDSVCIRTLLTLSNDSRSLLRVY